MTTPRAVAWLSVLMECVLPRDLGEVVVGDLTEEFPFRAEATSRARATWWFASQAATSVPRLLLLSTRRLAWLKSVGIAVAAYIVLGYAEPYMHRFVALIGEPGFRAQLVLDLCVGFAACACGGFLSTWVHRGSAVLYSLISAGYLGFVMMQYGINPTLPAWFPVSFLAVALVAPIVGGFAFVSLARRWKKRAQEEGGGYE